MRKRALFVALLALLGCSKISSADPPPGAPRVRLASSADGLPRASEIASRLQRSYDAEGAGNLDEALSAIEGIAGSDPAGYVAQLRRGWLLYRLGRHGESVASYERARAAAPDATEAKLGELPPLAALRRWVDVERLARDILAKDPASYTATLRLAYALYSQAKFVESAATYRRLLGAYPSDVEVRGGLGWALLRAGKATEAADVFRQVLDIAPRNALARDGLRATPGG